MKKFAVLIFVFLMIFNVAAFVPGVSAANNSEFIDVNVDGKTIEVRKVNVVINGQPLQSDVPPIIYETRTLVPIRFVAEQLNAEVEWVQETMEAKIHALGKEIVMKIDSKDVYINGVKKQLPYDVPAKAIDGRTMVPLRFVMEELNCDVDWNGDTWTAIVSFKQQEITDISVKDNTYSPSIIIETTGEVLYKAIELVDANKLVIDIPNSRLNVKDETKVDDKNIVNMSVDKLPIKTIRSSQFQVNPDITRVVIDLEKLTDYEIKHLENGMGIEVSFINRVTDITLETINDKETIVIHNSGEVELSTFALENPNRIVIDVKNSYYENEKYAYDIKTEHIKGIRAAQFEYLDQNDQSKNTVRIVLDLVEGGNIPDIETKIQDGNLLVSFNGTNPQVLEYISEEEDKATLNIDMLSAGEYEIKYGASKKLFEVIVPKDNINLASGMISINDSLVKNIIVGEDEENKRIIFDMKSEITYVDNSQKDSNRIAVTMEAKNNEFSDKVIVIDAGHGGVDPGTRGRVSLVREKDLNLIVAFKLRTILEDLGFKTVMTRDKDEYIGLYERADLANAADGDAFVSIHFNSHYNNAIGGIESIYCPSYESLVKTEDQYPFVETIHNEIVKALGREDRGIKRRPEIVVTRETEMVATLVELGFVSNPEEERTIVTYEYLNNAAQGIANGLVKYFSQE